MLFNNSLYGLLFGAFIFSCSCNVIEQIDVQTTNTYVGWWIYGNDFGHIFKDERTLKEWPMVFSDDMNKDDCVELYLSISEMEYFPLEIQINGRFVNDINQEDAVKPSKKISLKVVDFDILHLKGCY